MSNKVQSSARIKLAYEKETLITNEEEVAMKMNNFLSNTIFNLKIPKFESLDPLSENRHHPTLKTIVKYKKSEHY